MQILNNQIPPERLLAEIEDVLRTAPPRATMGHYTPDNLAWRGRASAIIAEWNLAQSGIFDLHVDKLGATMARDFDTGYDGTMVMLNRARADLRMRVIGPKNIAVDQGQVFEYFDELRKVIEPARQEIFFVDPYLDAQFVSRYMPHVHTDASVPPIPKPRQPARQTP